jgi:hypothetical protein
MGVSKIDSNHYKNIILRRNKMSSFNVGAVKDYRKLKGCVIRHYNKDNQLWKDIKASKCLRLLDSVWWVEIHNVIIESRQFVIEVRAKNLKDCIIGIGRNNVFYIQTPIDDNLSIEGNYRKGEKFKNEWFKEN